MIHPWSLFFVSSLLLLSFSSSICRCTQHGSLTVTIWIQSYRSVSALPGLVGNLHHYHVSPFLPPSLTFWWGFFLFLSPPSIFLYFIPRTIHHNGTGPFTKQPVSLSLCASVSVSAGHPVYKRSARWQRLRPDGWHLQSMVSGSWLGGGEKECLREKHVCPFANVKIRLLSRCFRCLGMLSRCINVYPNSSAMFNGSIAVHCGCAHQKPQCPRL